MTTTAAHLRPSARRALVPPVRPSRPSAGPCRRRPGHEDAHRDRAGEVGEEHQDDGPEHDRGIHGTLQRRSGALAAGAPEAGV